MTVSVKVTATLTDVSTGLGIPNKTVKFFKSYDDVNYTLVGQSVTNVDGVAEVMTTTDTVTWFKAVFEGDDDADPAEAKAMFTPREVAKGRNWWWLILLLGLVALESRKRKR